ncbi:MAG: ATP-binding protein, partial [Gaiellaceae bacterium]
MAVLAAFRQSPMRIKLLVRALALAVLPVVAVAFAALVLLDRLADSADESLDQSRVDLAQGVVGAGMTEHASLIARELDLFMRERIADAFTWASSPAIVEAARAGPAAAREQGLFDLSLDELETQFNDNPTRSMEISPVATQYLVGEVASSPHFGEAFFTGAMGFNLGATNQTSDFVQSDELWWQTAWQRGVHVGRIEFDESASIWSVDIGIRVDDPGTGTALGVLKVVLGTSLIQEIADVHAAAIVGGNVTVLTDSGLLIAETASGHATERIMNAGVNLRLSSDAAMRDVFAKPIGFRLSEETVSGFAATGPPTAGALVPRVDDFGWRVLVEQPASVAFAPLGGLVALQSDLDSSRTLILAMTGAVLLLVLIGSVAAVLALTRREDETRRAHAELEKSEKQRQRSQRMEAVGQLAGGVAHDFNNLLTAITGSSEFLLSDLDRDDPRREEAKEINTAAGRASSLTQQLLAFSRRQILKPEVLDLNSVVTDVDRMLRRLIGEHIELRTELAPDLGRISADPAQLEQVIVNLAVNARDAMPDGGVLTIETANVELDQPETDPGSHVMLAVSDTGCGMDEETQARIFEPFFTTKPPGEGSGLGLATIYGILKQSDGQVNVYSEQGVGTTVRVYLPATEALATQKDEPHTDRIERGEGTILVVEDEEAVRRTTRKALARRGYTVIDASDPLDALETLSDGLDSIDLLVTDVVMPQMSGPELVARLKEQRPELKVLFVSGYT